MMPREILLLTDANEAAGLMPLLANTALYLPVTLVQDLDKLEAARCLLRTSDRPRRHS
jgi:hypothetical protein